MRQSIYSALNGTMFEQEFWARQMFNLQTVNVNILASSMFLK